MSKVGEGTGTYIILADGRRGYIQRVTPEGYRFRKGDAEVRFYADGTADIIKSNSGKIFSLHAEDAARVAALVPRYPDVDTYIEALDANAVENEQRSTA